MSEKVEILAVVLVPARVANLAALKDYFAAVFEAVRKVMKLVISLATSTVDLMENKRVDKLVGLSEILWVHMTVEWLVLCVAVTTDDLKGNEMVVVKEYEVAVQKAVDRAVYWAVMTERMLGLKMDVV